MNKMTDGDMLKETTLPFYMKLFSKSKCLSVTVPDMHPTNKLDLLMP